MSPVTGLASIQRAIDLAGGPAEVARALGVTVQAVCFWRTGARKLPLDHCPMLQQLTGVACEELRPDKIEYFALIRKQFNAAALVNTAQPATESVANQGA